MKTLGYVDRGPKGGLMISETKVSRWVNQAVVSRDDAERTIAEAVAAERERCAKVCEGMVSGTFPDIKNPSGADQRTIAWDACCEEAAEKIRSAEK